MHKTAIRLAGALTLATLTAGAALATPARPSDSFPAQIYTSPEGCSYARAQVPGYPASWHLIVNPQRVNLPVPSGRCPVRL